MKTTKFEIILKSILFSMLLIAPMGAKAQYYSMDYGAGSPAWCWQQQQQLNAMSNQMMMMQQQVLAFYQNQRMNVEQQLMSGQPVQGIITYDGTYITPESVSNYHRENVKCEHCDNGKVTHRYMSDGKVRTIERRCGYCQGKGYTTRTVRNK